MHDGPGIWLRERLVIQLIGRLRKTLEAMELSFELLSVTTVYHSGKIRSSRRQRR